MVVPVGVGGMEVVPVDDVEGERGSKSMRRMRLLPKSAKSAEVPMESSAMP